MAEKGSLSPEVKRHVARVFALLLFTVVAAIGGCCVGVSLGLNKGGALACALTGAGALAFILCARDRSASAARVALLAVFGALEGASLSALMRVLPSLVVAKALVCTAVVFSCFAAAALVAKRRSYLFFGGALSSALTVLTLLSLCNLLFAASPFALDVQLYAGLAIFVGFVAVNTQAMVERASTSGTEPDAIADAATLFTDALSIFIRIAIILARNGREGGGGGGGGGGNSVLGGIVSGARDEL